uniref:Uncharacterized protein n=1 Tax=Curvibacter symbiont subsp. Hydra magnipapillata TaxID=667019 RepID=C9Y6R7_CURXX|nr:hypothetical protein Csp_E36440 [Curvibacter putative symbiont of Hydra magnipapillata]
MRWWGNLWNKLVKWFEAMNCEKRAIRKLKKLVLPFEPVTSEETLKIKNLCSMGLNLPWYLIADLVFQERIMKKAIDKVSADISNLTDEELEWIYDCLKSSQWGVDDLIQFLRKSRSSGTTLPTP